MLDLHHCIYFADLGMFQKKMLFFFLFRFKKCFTSHKKQCHFVPKKYIESEKYTDIFKTLNRSHSPDFE